MRRRKNLDPTWLAAWCACSLASAFTFGCGGDKAPAHTVTPAPAPAAPAEPTAAAPELPVGRDIPGAVPPPATAPASPATTAPTPSAKAKPAAGGAKPANAKAPPADKPRASTPKPTPIGPPPAPSPVPAATQPPVPTPAPATPAPATPAPAAPPPAAKGKVAVPSTDHVRIDVPKGMQALLDADTRMQPWVQKVVAVADRCYKSNGFGTKATIVVDVTMHKNARPDADMRSLPPTLAGVVGCATGDLMRTKMPLFTGPEGERHTLKINFK